MQLLNICTKKDYEKNGERKVAWYKVGVMKIADSGKMYIKLYQHPNTEFYVFNKHEKKEGAEWAPRPNSLPI